MTSTNRMTEAQRMAQTLGVVIGAASCCEEVTEERVTTVAVKLKQLVSATAEDGADAEAAMWLRRSIEANPNQSMSYFLLAATLAQLGNMNEARATVQAGLVRSTGFTIRRFRANPLSDNPTYLAWRERLYEAMRLAEVPEE